MNLLRLALFTLQIMLETIILPKLGTKYISPKMFNLAAMLLTAYIVKKDLKHKPNSLVFFLFLINTIVVKFLLDTYYPKSSNFDPGFELVTVFIFLSSFILAKKEDFDVFDQSKINRETFDFICSFVFSNKLANYIVDLKLYQILTLTSVESKFLIEFTETFLVDFIIIYGVNVAADLVNYKDGRNKTHLHNIFKMLGFFFVYLVLGYVIFSNAISNTLYDFLFSFISKPYNIMLYNMFAFAPLIKFKIAYATINFLMVKDK